MEASICKYFQTGFCKFGDHCQRHHVKETCDSITCVQSLCKQRHPKSCKFFTTQQKCKFNDNCAYKHVISKAKSDISLLMNELSSLKTINSMSAKMKFLESEIVKLNTNSNSTLNIKSKKTKFVKEDQTNVISTILNHDFLMKLLTNSIFLRKHTPQIL